MLVASKHEPYPSVNYDNSFGIREAMEYLIHTLGYRCFRTNLCTALCSVI